MKPTDDRVIIELDPLTEKLSAQSKLFAPDSVAKKMQQQDRQGTVIAVGPGRWGRRLTLTTPADETPGMNVAMHGHGEIREEAFRLPMECAVGDRVVWKPYTEIGVPKGFLGDDALGVEFSDDMQRELVVIGEDDILATIEESADGAV